MMAAQLTELPAAGLTLAERADPEPAATEVLVKVHACGICGTDLDILAARSYAPSLPFVMGHEPVGEVIGTGPGVQADWVGQRVTLTIFRGRDERCGVCQAHPDWATPCRTGDERLCCGGARVTGVLEDDGAFAELLVAAESQLVPVPSELKSTDAATLVDAGATAANAARQVPDDDPRPVLVVGAGPLGFFAAQLLRARHEVIAVEPQGARRAAMRRLGVDAVADLAELDVLAGAVVDCTGAPAVFPIGLELLGAGGTYVVAGYGPVEAHLAPVARKELTIRGVRSGRRADLERVLDALAAGDIAPPEVTTWPLTEINDAFAALRAGEVPGKAVIDLAAAGGPE